MSKFNNTDPFEPWNSVGKDEPWKAWNNPMYKNDPFAPWNNPMSSEREKEQYRRRNAIPKEDMR